MIQKGWLRGEPDNYAERWFAVGAFWFCNLLTLTVLMLFVYSAICCPGGW